MRRLQRRALSQPLLDRLADLTARVTSAADPRARARALWKAKPRPAFDEIRSQLEQMATGRARCMYCEDSLGTDIDHFRPKTAYPQHAFDWQNYLLACSHCNSNLKRSEFPLGAMGEPLLLDPTVDEPAEHLVFSPATGDLVAVGTKGLESIRVFGLNDDKSPRRLSSGRRDTLVILTALLQGYDREVASNHAKAAEIRETVRNHPFSAVLHWLVRIAQSAAAPDVLGAEVVSLVQTGTSAGSSGQRPSHGASA